DLRERDYLHFATVGKQCFRRSNYRIDGILDYERTALFRKSCDLTPFVRYYRYVAILRIDCVGISKSCNRVDNTRWSPFRRKDSMRSVDIKIFQKYCDRCSSRWNEYHFNVKNFPKVLLDTDRKLLSFGPIIGKVLVVRFKDRIWPLIVVHRDQPSIELRL